MLIRPAGPTDLDTVAALRLDFLAELQDVDRCGLEDDLGDTTRAWVRRHHRAGTVRSWLAEHGGGPAVGVVSVLLRELPPHPSTPVQHEGYVINVYVVPDHRRAGVARALMERCVAAGPSLPVRELVLRATEAGRPLYASLGFTAPQDVMERRPA